MKRGWNWLQFMWANTLIDPTSLTLRPLEHGDKIDVEQLVYPARLKDIGRWLIRSEVEGAVPFEITYMTSGLKWRAFYMGTLSADEQTMGLEGFVRVDNNSGEDYADARTRLIVGKVHLLDAIADLARRQYAYGRPGIVKGLGIQHGVNVNGRWKRETADTSHFAYYDNFSLGFETMSRKEIKKEGLSEYFLYTIEGRETIPNTWGKRLPSFEADGIEVESLYKYDEDRWGASTVRFLSFANDEDHELGQTPIPGGNVRIYRDADSEGHLSYVGATDVKYIPVDEEVELELGAARHVKVAPLLVESMTENYVFDGKGNVCGWDEVRGWKIEVTNARKLDAEIEITRGFGTAYWKLDRQGGDVDYEKHDATHARFTLDAGARTVRNLTYTVRTYHGTRQEKIPK
jgi:hypothetical protein